MLRKHFRWTFTGNALYAGSRWLTFAALAKLITPMEVGQYALALAIVIPVFALAGMNLRTIQSTDAKAETSFRDLVTLRLITTLFASIVCLAISLFVARFHDIRSLIILAALIQSGDALSDIVFGLFDHCERFDLGATSLALRGPFRLIALSIVLFATRDIALAMFAEAVVNAGVFIGFDCVACRRLLRERAVASGRDDALALRWRAPILFQLVSVSLPMAGLLLIAAVQSNIPRYVVEYFEGSHEVGVFAALSVLALAQTPFVSALTQATLPKLARYWSVADRRSFLALLRVATGFALGLGLLGIAVAAFAGEPLLRWLYTVDYAAQSDLLIWLMAAATAVSLANVYGGGITATRGFRSALVSQAIMFAVALPIYAVLTSRSGTTGAAIGLLVHSLLSLSGYVFILHRVRFPPTRNAQPS